MKFITHRSGSFDLPIEVGSHVELKNIFDRSITINALSSDVRPGETFTLTKEQVNNGDIRAALGKGMIKIMSSVVKSKPEGEATVKVGDLFSEDSGEVSEERNIDFEDDIDTIGGAEDYLETNEEASIPTVVDVAEELNVKTVEMTNVIDTENPDPVSGSEDDPKGKSIVWNPNKDPVVGTRGKMDAISVSKDGVEHSPMSEGNVDVEDINFVDQELEAKRRSSHPKLKDKPVENNNELDFI